MRTALKASHVSTELAAELPGGLGTVIQRLRQWAGDRALRRQLADMDDTMLRDIGIAEDEIWRVRNREIFTPRAWR
jgi:uncharacterized protein YjiS (DUF1127 family)